MQTIQTSAKKLTKKLVIEKLPDNYLLASTLQNEQSPEYLTSTQGTPLKFLNVEHIKEFLEGERIEQVFMMSDNGQQEELSYW